MPLQKKFITQPTAIASYDSTDIAEGTGTIIFYGAQGELTGGAFNFLTRTVVPSRDQVTESAELGATDAMVLDLDFDLSPFNLPKTVKGTANISVPFALNGQSTICRGYVKAKLRHWDGTTETEIASATSDTVTKASGLHRAWFLLKITVPRTHFKKGETLRLTIEVWGDDDAGAGWHHLYIGHDPKGRLGWKDSTANAAVIFPGTDVYNVTPVLQAQIPFELDL